MPREAGHEAKVKWLYDRWERIDGWISEKRPCDAAVLAEMPGESVTSQSGNDALR
jgi:hypothetical protein